MESPPTLLDLLTVTQQVDPVLFAKVVTASIRPTACDKDRISPGIGLGVLRSGDMTGASGKSLPREIASSRAFFPFAARIPSFAVPFPAPVPLTATEPISAPVVLS